MPVDLVSIEVGPWPMNCYLLIDAGTKSCMIIDPGAMASVILKHVQEYHVECIMITHGHADHVGALKKVKQTTLVPVLINPLEATRFKISYDQPLVDGQEIRLGDAVIKPIHTPGHTAGMMSFDLGDNRVIVGDTIFVGGPGKTWSADDFNLTMKTMEHIVFKWSDGTRFYPGHGPSGLIGNERPAYQEFIKNGWPQGTYGDITWV